ncbi:MAG: 6-phosphogluconolactonase [Propionibacteriaceae bacterium]|jgi:6-phosphogluconolactonase|nr:6-phosphogluconolactonase [Propionibacteriaceae bacterium]
MSLDRMLRFDDRASLAESTASLLLETMAVRQREAGTVSLCVTGGELSYDIFGHMAQQGPHHTLDASNVHLWWNWDYFLPLDNPDRNSLTALSRLGGVFGFDPTKIHAIPSVEVCSDSEAGADQYGQELRASNPIDICLVELGGQGQIAGIFPHHKPTAPGVLATSIHDAPLDHPELITLTTAGLNTCREIWVLAHGEDVAPLLDQLRGQDTPMPIGELTGREIVLFLTDVLAASLLDFHHCHL